VIAENVTPAGAGSDNAGADATLGPAFVTWIVKGKLVPAMADTGIPPCMTETSADVPTVNAAVAALLAESGSLGCATTAVSATTVPSAVPGSIVPSIVNVTLAPAAIETAVQEELHEIPVTPAGEVWLTTTLETSLGPWLVTVMVQDAGAPALAVVLTRFVTTRSALAVVTADAEAPSFEESGSGVDAVTDTLAVRVVPAGVDGATVPLIVKMALPPAASAGEMHDPLQEPGVTSGGRR
jgi:hypothetical protein